MLPERIPPRPGGVVDPGDVTILRRFCEWRDRWGISSDLAVYLTILQERISWAVLFIISGYRTPEEQEALRRNPQGRPVAPDALSTHLTCPATGADLMLSIAVTDVVKAQFGVQVRLTGLRWGGGSAVDPQTGIPVDWNHVDLGPRR